MAREKIAKPKKFQQNNGVKQHFHPRGLARGIVHRRMENAEMYGVNKVRPGADKSPFAKAWRKDAGMFAREI